MKKILTIKLLIFSILTMSGCGPGSLKDTVVPVQMKCGQSRRNVLWKRVRIWGRKILIWQKPI